MNLVRAQEWLRRRLGRGRTPPSTSEAPHLEPQTDGQDAPEQFRDQLARAWLTDRLGRGRLYVDLAEDRVAVLQRRFPDHTQRTCAAAERALRHEFDLLGSGPTVPVDPARTASADGYQPIDWSLDPVAGLRFPTGFHVRAWKPDMRPGLADVKWPWEIGRCQHWVTLGQAYRLTGDERFAREIVRQHADFMEANPVGFGIQYIVAMDVAIRAFNWALAFELIQRSAAFQGAEERAYQSLFDTGVFIERHLENTYEVTSNHFLSNVIGLYGLGVVFADLPVGKRWLRQGRDWLEQEMLVQVLPDGVDYESSVPYHRLVLELFLAGERVAEIEGTPLSEAYRSSLKRMSAFMAAALRPDGLLPQIGDADDGRLHIFSDYGTWLPQDGRHILAPAAFMFGEPEWLGLAGDAALWEAAWWGYDVGNVQPVTASATATAMLFPQAGLAAAKTDQVYLLITNGRVGTNGFGNHKHNDLLSFEFHAAGSPLIVDPGSYVYTSDPDARNLFRSTRYHNTVEIDGVEQNDLRLDYLFRMFETSTVAHHVFRDTAAHTVYRGAHTGYMRLPDPIEHQRTFRLVKDAGALLILDQFTGTGTHRLSWHFHIAPGVDVEPVGTDTREFLLVAPTGRWRLRADHSLTGTVADVWYSPSYGTRISCRAIDWRVTVDTGGRRDFAFTLAPELWIDTAAMASEATALRADAEMNPETESNA